MGTAAKSRQCVRLREFGAEMNNRIESRQPAQCICQFDRRAAKRPPAPRREPPNRRKKPPVKEPPRRDPEISDPRDPPPAGDPPPKRPPSKVTAIPYQCKLSQLLVVGAGEFNRAAL